GVRNCITRDVRFAAMAISPVWLPQGRPAGGAPICGLVKGGATAASELAHASRVKRVRHSPRISHRRRHCLAGIVGLSIHSVWSAPKLILGLTTLLTLTPVKSSTLKASTWLSLFDPTTQTFILQAVSSRLGRSVRKGHGCSQHPAFPASL